MSDTIQKSDGRFLSGLFFRVLPAQIFLLLTGINNIVNKKGGDVLMSIKDDCKAYNPRDREAFLNPQDDSPKSISIRLFMGIIKSTEYQLTLGINVFTVTV